MNRIKQLLAELAGLKSAIEAGDEAAMDRADQIMNDELPKAKRAEALAKAITGAKVDPEPEAETPAKSLGEYAVKNLDLTGIRSGSTRTASTGYGYKAATDAHTAPTIVTTSTNLPEHPRNTQLRDLFGAEAISGNAYTFFIEDAQEGAPTSVAENGQKPQFNVSYTPETMPLGKVAGWFYETDELLEDAPFMASAIDNRGLRALDNAIETELGTQLLNTSGIQTMTGGVTADAVFKATMDVKAVSNYEADAILINPADYQTLRLAKDGNQQYYGGGYFYGPYGNTEIAQQPGLWGLATVITNAVPAGTAIVGAFRDGGTVVTKADAGARVEIVTGDHDDRTNNRVTVIVEERLALAVRYPGAFVKISA